MAIASKFNLGIKFDLGLLPFFYDLTDNTDYASEGIAAADVKGNFEIIDPIGQSYINTSWITPDIDLAVNTSFAGANIRLNSANFPYNGLYIFRYTVLISGAVQPGTYVTDFQINFTYQRPKVQINFENNPYVTLLQARDVTPYVIEGVVPVIIRVFTLIFPPLQNTPNIVTSLAYIAVTAPFYFEGLYSATLGAQLLYVFPTYTVHDNITGDNDFIVEDTVNIQSIYCCLKKLNAQAVSIKNTNPSLYTELIGKITRATSLLDLYDQAVQFGQYADAGKYIEEIYCVTECTRGCTCGDLTPSSIQPYWMYVNSPGGSGGGIVTNGFEIGDIAITTASVIPINWLFCIGQVVAIVDYQELYDVYGTQFNTGSEPGGYFRIPDFRGRSPIGAGTGPGLNNRVLGQSYGTEYATVTHSHGVSGIAIANHTISPHVASLTIGNALGSYTPAGSIIVNSALGNYTPSGTISVASALGGYTPEGSVTLDSIDLSPHDISGLGVNVTGSTGTGTTGATAPGISGTGNVSVSVTGSTGTGTTGSAIAPILLIINPADPNDGIFESETKSGLTVSAPACLANPTDVTEVFTYMPCEGVTVADFTITIDASNLIGPTGALALDQTSHTHSIPSLSVAASGTIAASTIAGTLSVSSHSHSIPALTVTGTGVISGTIPDHTVVSSTLTFVGVPANLAHTHVATFNGTPTSLAHIHTGSFAGTAVDLTHTHGGTLSIDNHATLVHSISGTTDVASPIISILQPVLTTNFKIRVK